MECHLSSATLPRKLTGSTSIYDGVFSGSSRGSRVSSGVEDYAEVFGGGEDTRREAIPVLDIPCFREGRLMVDVRASALDYVAVFRGGAGGFAVSSYEEVIGDRGKAGRRVKTKKRSPSQLSNNGLEEGHSVNELSSPSSNEAKRFNVSYCKSNVGSSHKPNGAVHVAQMADIAGYSILVDERDCLNQAKDMEPVGSADAGSHAGVGMVEGDDCKDASSGVSAEYSAERSSIKGISRHRSSKSGSFSGELLFDRCGFMVGKDSYGQNLQSDLFSASPGKKGETNGRVSPRSVSEGVDWLPDLGSGLDANSVASATATAVKIAIERAQARIKAAKEKMEGKKVFEFKVSVKKKLDREHIKSNTKATKEALDPRVLHPEVRDEDTLVHSLNGIRKPNLSKVHAVTAEMIVSVKKPALRESFVVGPEEKRCETGVDCVKENRVQEEDLFEDARAEPHHSVRDEQLEVISGKNDNQPSDVQDSNYNRSATRNSVVVVSAERVLSESLYQQKVNPGQLIYREAKESKEKRAAFILADKMTAKKGNAPYMHTVSDDFKNIKEFAFHFHMTPFEKLPELRIPEPEVNLSSQLSVGPMLENCAACVNTDHKKDREHGGDFSDEHEDEMKGDLGMAIGNGEIGEEQEQCCDVVNSGVQFEELLTVENHGLEYNIESMGVEPEARVSEVYDPATPKEKNDNLCRKNYDVFQEESPYCGEADPCEMILPDGYRVEDLKTCPETCDAIKAQTVPADVRPMRRFWTMEAHDVRLLINAVAANACEANIHEQMIGTQEDDLQSQDQTMDVVDNVEKEDCNKMMLKNSPALLGGDSIIMEKYLAEPIDLSGDTFRCEEMTPEDYATEALDSWGATANLDDASVESDLTDDEVSERSSTDEAPMQGAFCESEDNKLNESEVSEFSGPESEASVEEAKSEAGAEISVDDFICAVMAGTSQLNDGFAKKGEAQTVDESTYADKHGDNHQAKLVNEEVEAKVCLGSEKRVEETRSKTVDEDKESERAREKERKAVERAIREARERAYVVARERAERAAVEKDTAEAQQRGMTQAREKLGKSSSERSNRADDKKFVKAKLKAERTAVERATAEARERALEKALAEKLAASGKDYKPGRKSNEQQHRSSGLSNNLRHPSTFDPSTHCAKRSEGDNGESAQRRKARLERHQRTAERAAKALAEKNKRDLLALREQAERNRLAETLDADIKRWLSGKQGNLRALLSTLQYILGPDSGWHPVTLTEIVTAAAVKKAYRKATLYVHPDKLQQRGASLQQKYICEKVFDLLKDAWNKFDAEER